MDMQDVVIQLHEREYHDFARYLTALNFRAIVLDTPRRRFHTALQLLLQYLCGLGELLPHLPSMRGVRTVVVFSHFAFVVKLLARCGLVNYERLFCFGFLVHDPRWFRVVRCLVRMDRAHDHYVIFSESEAEVYRCKFGIERKRMHFVPLGDWRQIRGAGTQAEPERGDYYLAGGRSNRDYAALVETFRSLSARLVILCSQVNLEELGLAPMPDNITVLCDVPITTFDEYVRGAKAGIIALRHDTGSAGQSVALALMRNAKCILATRTGGLMEYVEDGVSGHWIDDVARDLPECVRQIEADPHRAKEMGEAGRRRYEERFSLTTAAEAFENVLATVPMGKDPPHDEPAIRAA
jgi:glycosyltransferase involved in cell wall biosynthesis